jgi:hypothetical protein
MVSSCHALIGPWLRRLEEQTLWESKETELQRLQVELELRQEMWREEERELELELQAEQECLC